MKASMGLSILVQAYIAAIGILLMPVYLHQLGAEAFGLVGVFLMAQAWIQVLDMGFTPALSREISRMRAGDLSREVAGSRLLALEWLLGALGLGVVALIGATRDLIARHWIHAHTLEPRTIELCIALIGGAVALRWFAGLYRGVLTGLEQQHRANALLAGFATLRFAGVIPLLLFFSSSPEVFFEYQVLVSAVELLVSRSLGRSQIPVTKGARPRFASLKSMLPLVGGMAFLNATWIALTQIDKLILSGVLSLRDYGYFTMAVMAAGGVLILVPPMNQVIQPRLTFLFARGDHYMLRQLYSLASQIGTIGFFGLGASLAFFAETILHLWTGDAEVARASAPILFWYGIANAIVGIMLTPFMLQLAKGDLRLHVIGHVVLLFTLVPALIIAARHYGAVGAGQVFFAVNILFLLAWMPLVHSRFLPELTWRWLAQDTLPLMVLIMGILWLAARQMPAEMGPFTSLAWMGGAALLAMLAGVFAGTHTRRFAIQALHAAE